MRGLDLKLSTKLGHYQQISFHELTRNLEKRVYRGQVTKPIFHERKIVFVQFSKILLLYFRWKQIYKILDIT